MTKEQRVTAKRARHAKVRAALKRAVAKGFAPKMARGEKGYWTALRTYCFANGIPYPSRKPEPAPKAKR